ncbi:MAG TPA: O-antigen ligase family protein [Rhizomicrobium sp.]
MATDALASGLAPERRNLAMRATEIGFVLVMLLIFVGLTPFDDRTAAAIAARDAASAAGDSLRQVAFLGTFALILYGAVSQRGVQALRAVPAMVALLLLWCFVTALWSIEPSVVLRRAVLAAIFVLSMLLVVDTLGTARTIALWRGVVAAIIVADLVSVVLVHNAVHQPDDLEGNLAGAWRGLHSHKNMAGSVAASAAAMFFYLALDRRRKSDMALCAASLFFLVMTRSKSSLGLLPVALLAGGLYRVALRNALDRSIAAVAAALFVLGFGLLVALQWQTLARFLEDPQHFTGRAAIWSAEIAFIRDHPFIGSGFGSFGNTGMRSPIYQYVGAGWVSQIGEGHSGYLEMVVTLGGIGFAIGMIGLIVLPFASFWRPERAGSNLNALLFTLFTFDVLHNFMESDFVQVTSAQWGQMLLVIALLRVSEREARARIAAWAP